MDNGAVEKVQRPITLFQLKADRVRRSGLHVQGRHDPVALADDAGNHFLARAEHPAKDGKWWRPGMSGIAKIDVGQRSIIWILTHRTIDFFQMLIWW